ncbi:MAG: hypothetical protein OXN95_14350 [bacterium]|nr:hypothetical protein [bacterium]
MSLLRKTLGTLHLMALPSMFWSHRLAVSLVSLVAARILHAVLKAREGNAIFEAGDWLRFSVGTLFLIGALWPISLVYILFMDSRVASVLGSIVLLVGFPIIYGIAARSDSSTAGLGLITLPYIVILPALLAVLIVEAAMQRIWTERLSGPHSARRAP